MGWETSNRRERLPDNWPALRAKVLKRDGHRCTHRDHGIRCANRATDVDHIRRGDDHSETNLRSLCSGHHRVKSSREGGQANQAKRRLNAKRFRRNERHPGLL